MFVKFSFMCTFVGYACILPVVDGSWIAERGAEPLLEQPLAEGRLAAIEGLEEGALYCPRAAILKDVQIVECDAVEHLTIFKRKAKWRNDDN